MGGCVRGKGEAEADGDDELAAEVFGGGPADLTRRLSHPGRPFRVRPLRTDLASLEVAVLLVEVVDCH